MFREVEEAWNYIGDYYAERHKWEEAVQYYEKSRLVLHFPPIYSLAFFRQGIMNLSDFRINQNGSQENPIKPYKKYRTIL